MKSMAKLFSMLRDSKFVLALIALIIVCTTVLIALGQVTFADAVKALGGLLTGVLLAWQRSESAPEADE